MYLEHFGLEHMPFSLSPNTGFYCELPHYQEALIMLKAALKSGEGFIKIVGEVGLGKTTLCRQFLNTLPDHVVAAYLPNPNLNPHAFKRAFGRELPINVDQITHEEQLDQRIVEALCTYHQKGQHVVLVVDEAQAMSDETLETIRLLSNIETESAKLLQIVLFAQPELDARLKQPQLRQLQQRILFSYTLKPLSFEEMTAYIAHRLTKAGYQRGHLVQPKAFKTLYAASGGVPRLINALCHKSLLSAWGRGASTVNHADIKEAINDSQAQLATTSQPTKNSLATKLTFIPIGTLAILLAWFFHYHHIAL